MELKINKISYTSKINSDSLRLRQYGANRSDIYFFLEYMDGDYPGNIKVGMEIEIKDEYGKTLWGGIVEKLSFKIRSQKALTVGVFGRGYESVVKRVVIPSLTHSFPMSSAAIRIIFTQYLRDEGISLDSVSLPAISYPIEFNYGGAVSLEEVFDVICSYYGLVWWIDKYKTLTFTEQINLNNVDKTFDLDSSNHFDLLEATVVECLEDYRNIQYITMNDGSQYAMAENQEAITAMSEYFGTGKFSSVIKKPRVADLGQGNALAQKYLENYAEPPIFAKFKFAPLGFRLKMFDRVTVNSSLFSQPKSFIVTAIESEYKGNEWIDNTILRAFSGDKYIPLVSPLKNISFNL